MNKKTQRRLLVTTALIAAVLAMSGIAYAVTTDTTQTTAMTATQSRVSSTTADDHGAGHGQGHGQENGGSEEPLTGDLATQVASAGEAAVPGGTVVRVETDAQGAAYEAHMTDANGNPVVVAFDENLNVLSTDQGH
ncbi:MAG: hypothetical protein WBV06_15620 [Acidimicrobiia bacterium]